MDSGGLSDDGIKRLLAEVRTIAVVGLSANPDKDSRRDCVPCSEEWGNAAHRRRKSFSSAWGSGDPVEEHARNDAMKLADA